MNKNFDRRKYQYGRGSREIKTEEKYMMDLQLCETYDMLKGLAMAGGIGKFKYRNMHGHAYKMRYKNDPRKFLSVTTRVMYVVDVG